MSSAHFRPAISTPLSPARQLIIINSDTEAESLSPYVNDDNDSASIIENQARLPKSQHCIANLSPPPEASDGVNHGVSNNNAEAACGAQVSVHKGNTSGVTNTDIVLSLGNKEMTKIEVHIEGSYHSNPTINISIEQAQVRQRKYEHEIEGYEGKMEVHVQVKKSRK